MEIDKIIVLLSGIGICIFIAKYFLLYKEPEVSTSSDRVDILVDGGYSPKIIRLKSGRKVILNFLRKDPSSCLEEVVLPDFGKRAFLPLEKTTTVEIYTDKIGEFEISCGMNMFHAKLIIEG